jgi:hypothetical protein
MTIAVSAEVTEVCPSSQAHQQRQQYLHKFTLWPGHVGQDIGCKIVFTISMKISILGLCRCGKQHYSSNSRSN